MSRVVDARGLACPQPVILTRRAMTEAAEVITLVDSETARDNVRRMAEKAGRRVTVEQGKGEFRLTIADEQAEQQPAVEPVAAPAPAGGSLVLVVPDNKMGRGDQQLGEILVRGFFHSLLEVEPRPDTVIFFNAGAWLVIDGSPVLEDLQALESRGAVLLACGTCLNHLGIVDRVAVGQVSNMYDIAETLLRAGKVVTL